MPAPLADVSTSSVAAPMKSRVAMDLTGQVFGRLTVMSRATSNRGGQRMWVCKCACAAGTICVVACNNLVSGNSTSCGCFRREQLLANAPIKDITGQRFGRWLVTGRAGRTAKSQATWTCVCDCGEIRAVAGSDLRNGSSTSCGKHQVKLNLKNLQGQRFGKLVVVSREGNTRTGACTWRCMCDCGNVKVVTGFHLRRRSVVSCGLHKEGQARIRFTRHGQITRRGRTGAYESWAHMIERCSNPNVKCWKDYGGRGISVCESWKNFENFYADMHDRPTGLTIERVDVNGNYEPGNCVWDDKFRQAQNHRIHTGNKTGVKGVAAAGKHRYRAGIGAFGKKIFLGYFPRTEEGLARARAVRELAEELYWGYPK
jgi:hypothetical protein